MIERVEEEKRKVSGSGWGTAGQEVGVVVVRELSR